MSKRSKERADVVSVRVMREQEWVYDLRAAHHSVREISFMSYRSREEGGLGYGLSMSAVRGLLNGYIERMRDALTESPAERIAQEIADLDMQHRAAVRLMAPTKDFDDAGMEVEVPADPRVVVAALNTLRAIGERRAKLLGLDAETKATVTVNHVDPTDEAIKELARELDRH